MKLVDLHVHSLLSDGVYFPMELVRRAQVKGYAVMAITDHVDTSNISRVVPEVVKAAAEINRRVKEIGVIPGAEITHPPVGSIKELVKEARKLGAKVVLVHGETLAEPVVPGTNRKALEAGIDILAHPGLISEEDFLFAKKQGVRLEVSARRGHSLSNGYLVGLWRRLGGNLIINTDGHHDDDLFTEVKYYNVGMGAGLTRPEVTQILKATLFFAQSKL
jgi:histidinol phosphatase-like PHP family hydrolase